MIPFYKRVILRLLFPVLHILWFVSVIYLAFYRDLYDSTVLRIVLWLLLMLILGVNTILLIRWSRCPHCEHFLPRTVIFAPGRTFACPECGEQIIVQ